MNILKADWREILIGVLSAVLIAIGDQIGLSETAREVVGWLGGSYIGSNAVAKINVRKRLEDVRTQLSSRKFIISLLGIALTTLGSRLGIDLSWAIGILGGVANFGIGTADAFGIKRTEDVTIASNLSNSQPDSPIAPQFTDNEYGD